MINEKDIKAEDLIDVSDKPAVSSIRVGIICMFFFLFLRNGKLLKETTVGKASVVF
jgi:hypothetical protein